MKSDSKYYVKPPLHEEWTTARETDKLIYKLTGDIKVPIIINTSSNVEAPDTVTIPADRYSDMCPKEIRIYDYDEGRVAVSIVQHNNLTYKRKSTTHVVVSQHTNIEEVIQHMLT